MPVCSLVLSTYNGEKYIDEQLRSIEGQSLDGLRVSICDDCSADSTTKHIETFINDNSLNWLFSVNDSNIGWQQNFYSMLISAQGTYVFPCDQDDIWLSNKVERMVSVMEEHPEINVLASDVEPFTEAGGTISAGYTALPLKAADSAGLRFLELDHWSMYVHRPGCSFCIRKSFIDMIKPYWNPHWPHDATLWRFAAASNSLALLEEPLVRFRRHDENASDRKTVTRLSRMEEMVYYLEMLAEIERFGIETHLLSDSVVSLIASTKGWFAARRDLLSHRSLRALLKVLSHREFYATKKGLFVDLLLSINRRASL